MKYILIFILTLLTINGCKSKPYVHPKLILYYNEFIKDAELYNVDISKLKTINEVTIGKLDGDDLGESNEFSYMFYNKKTITISDKIMDDTELRYVLFHELGHLVLNLDHVITFDFRINSPGFDSTEYYNSNWEVLKQKYFQDAYNKQHKINKISD